MMRGRWSRAAAAALALGVACAMLPVFEDTKGQQASPPVVLRTRSGRCPLLPQSRMIALARSRYSRRPAR
jgi:hypothetical protein